MFSSWAPAPLRNPPPAFFALAMFSTATLLPPNTWASASCRQSALITLTLQVTLAGNAGRFISDGMFTQYLPDNACRVIEPTLYTVIFQEIRVAIGGSFRGIHSPLGRSYPRSFMLCSVCSHIWILSPDNPCLRRLASVVVKLCSHTSLLPLYPTSLAFCIQACGWWILRGAMSHMLWLSPLDNRIAARRRDVRVCRHVVHVCVTSNP